MQSVTEDAVTAIGGISLTIEQINEITSNLGRTKGAAIFLAGAGIGQLVS